MNKRKKEIPGGNQLVTKCIAQLWPYFKAWAWGYFVHIGGSQDVVLLIKCASQAQGFGWFLLVNTTLETKDYRILECFAFDGG